MKKFKNPFTVFGLVFVFTYIYLFQILSYFLKIKSLVLVGVLQGLIPLLVIGVIFFLVLKGEGKKLTSLSLRKPSKDDVLWGFIGFFLGLAVNFMVSLITPQFLKPEKDLAILQVLRQMPLGLGIFFIFTSAVSEEVLFRGFAVERLNSWFKNLNLASAVSWLFFSLGHLYPWGLKYTLHLAVFSLTFYFVYLRRRNLYSTIIMHLINNLAAFMATRLLI